MKGLLLHGSLTSLPQQPLPQPLRLPLLLLRLPEGVRLQLTLAFLLAFLQPLLQPLLQLMLHHRRQPIGPKQWPPPQAAAGMQAAAGTPWRLLPLPLMQR